MESSALMKAACQGIAWQLHTAQVAEHKQAPGKTHSPGEVCPLSDEEACAPLSPIVVREFRRSNHED